MVDLIHDLYSASVDNQRFFHGRLVDPTSEQNKYRELISEAVLQANSQTWAHPVVLGTSLVIRDADSVAVWSLK